MKVSVNWMRTMNRNYGCSDSSELKDIDKLVEKIGAQLGAIDGVIDLGERYKGIVVAKVVSAEKHPNADKLKVCWIDDGGAIKDVARNEKGHVHVVCGAPNVAAGQLVAWLPPGSTVPATYNKDPFVLEAREIRGEMSNGMIASAKELALGDNHEGILVLDEGKPGDDLAKNLQLDDYIIDIENKMFTHRPDLFGILGIAREIAGISGKPFKSPDWYREDADTFSDGRKNVLKLDVKNQVPELVPRFCALAIKDVKVADSPAWLQAWLARVGIRPINNIVDATNFFMQATGQPLHAYDYDKVKTGTLGIRLSKKGERLRLLGGKEIELDGQAVVITDGEKPIGLGGVMGGADTEVDEKTKNIILEVANFDMNLTRKTAMAYGLFTDAATRFTKNQSPRQNRAVLVKAATDILALAGGRIATPVIDDKNFEAEQLNISLSEEFINSRLGTDLSAGEMKKILENVEFAVEQSKTHLAVTPPFWRADIELPEDIVEEVGRLYGYDKLPLGLPKRDISPAPRDSLLALKSRLRDIMRRAGANEVLTYSFVHGSLLKKAGQKPEHAYRLRNAVSPDLQYYRLSLTPSLLDKVHANIRAGFDSFCLFEIGTVHSKTETDKQGLPAEFGRLASVFASKYKATGASFYIAKRYLQFIGEEFGLELSFEELPHADIKGHELIGQMVVPYEPLRSAAVMMGGQFVGVAGEFKSAIKSSLKLPAACAGFELFVSAFDATQPPKYRPLNRFPSLEQDFCLRTKSTKSYGQLAEFMNGGLVELSKDKGYGFSLEPIDIFQRSEDKEHKQTTWRITLWHPGRTLTTEETNKLLDSLAAKAAEELKAERI